jgi:drug/metabolite transporter (DMT)-like permease
MTRWRLYLVGFLLLMAFDTMGQLAFKYAGSHALPAEASLAWLARLFGQPWVYLSVLAYVANFFIWMTLLEHAPIGPAFAATHLEVVSVMLCSVWLFHEPLTWPRALGAAAIVAGIACLALAEGREQQEQAPAAGGP